MKSAPGSLLPLLCALCLLPGTVDASDCVVIVELQAGDSISVGELGHLITDQLGHPATVEEVVRDYMIEAATHLPLCLCTIGRVLEVNGLELRTREVGGQLEHQLQAFRVKAVLCAGGNRYITSYRIGFLLKLPNELPPEGLSLSELSPTEQDAVASLLAYEDLLDNYNQLPEALEAFQRRCGLPSTNRLDADTLFFLRESVLPSGEPFLTGAYPLTQAESNGMFAVMRARMARQMDPPTQGLILLRAKDTLIPKDTLILGDLPARMDEHLALMGLFDGLAGGWRVPGQTKPTGCQALSRANQTYRVPGKPNLPGARANQTYRVPGTFGQTKPTGCQPNLNLPGA